LNSFDSERIVFIDESGFNESLIRDYAWSKKGKPVIADKRGKKPKRLNLIAGLFNKKIIAPILFNGYTDSILFNEWLEKHLLPLLPKGSLLVLDNARFHKSVKTKELVEKSGYHLLFLPPYSPDLNPIEIFWAVLKAKVRNLSSYTTSLFESIELAIQS
jgi:transposase